jgi:hypothetical protein
MGIGNIKTSRMAHHKGAPAGPTHQKPLDLPQSRRGREGSQRRSSMSARDHDGFFRMIFRFHSAIFEILCVSQRPLRLCGEKNSI